MLKIVHAPNPVLSTPAPNVPMASGQAVNAEIQKLLKQMEESLLAADDPKGVGLAAPQIGKSVSIFITKPSDKAKTQVFINPKIEQYLDEVVPAKKRAKSRGRTKNKQLEGCLSLPDVWGEVKRYPSVILSFYDENGKFYKKTFKGFMAVIIQHEVDHLNGILFPKRVLEQKGELFESKKDEKGDTIFEPIRI